MVSRSASLRRTLFFRTRAYHPKAPEICAPYTLTVSEQYVRQAVRRVEVDRRGANWCWTTLWANCWHRGVAHHVTSPRRYTKVRCVQTLQVTGPLHALQTKIRPFPRRQALLFLHLY